MITITDPSQCCGCSACANICPHKAISMSPDALGFLYPEVDTQKCVECGLCEKVCAFNDSYDRSNNLPEPDVYAARHKDIAEIEKSRSGAMFAALSDWVFDTGGVVYGAGYADHFRVIHKRATTRTLRDEFRGSKYVQSDMGHVFCDVAEDLRAGKVVLFTGTPCQTSGLQSFLKLRHVSAELLYVVDIVCHGVPGPYIWRDYLAYLEKKHGSKVLAVDFRDKSEFGWAAHRETFTFKDGRKFIPTYTFYQHVVFRHSCDVCHFSNLRRPSDITIADFWGWEKVDKTFNSDDRGVSLVLVNSSKGRQLFDEVKSCMNYIPSDTHSCLQYNLQHPSQALPFRDKFERDYIKHGFVYVMKHYGNVGWRYKLKIIIGKLNTLRRLLIER